MRNEVALKIDPWFNSSRGMDGGRTGPGNPGPHSQDIIELENYCSSFAQFLERRRSATTIDQNHARTHKLDVPMGAHVPSASRTAIGVAAANRKEYSRDGFLRMLDLRNNARVLGFAQKRGKISAREVEPRGIFPRGTTEPRQYLRSG